ncbi:hypothetical protein [Paraburkholderia bryophila]|uniref:Uncharacterized protein n=1 Tax=Paraburkholderia bryophila TaxID=420952 RepID=A0A7Z0B8W8_9BURK|nr:hypothetical protein [Paraburkholderia bryophila]NYH24663.1 hypothetical protein [Paraburkholderia bryophila]
MNTHFIVVPVPNEAEREKVVATLKKELTADQFARVFIEVRPDTFTPHKSPKINTKIGLPTGSGMRED